MFRFSLQSVLEVRERMERMKQKEYAEALLARQRLEQRIATNEESLVLSSTSMDSVRRENPNPFALQMHGNYRQRLKNEIGIIQTQIREQGQTVLAKRDALVEARRGHRSLELLRDKEKKRYDQENARLERLELDEISTNFHRFRQ